MGAEYPICRIILVLWRPSRFGIFASCQSSNCRSGGNPYLNVHEDEIKVLSFRHVFSDLVVGFSAIFCYHNVIDFLQFEHAKKTLASSYKNGAGEENIP